MRLLVALGLAVALAGCSDWQEMGVAIANEGPATHVTVTFDRDKGKTYTFDYDVAANDTVVDTWSLPQDTFDVTVRAGELEVTGNENLCASSGFTIRVNATAVTYEYDRGDGFTGC